MARWNKAFYLLLVVVVGCGDSIGPTLVEDDEGAEATEELWSTEAVGVLGGPPASNIAPHFDVGGLHCGAGQMDCDPQSDQCFCPNDFARNAYFVDGTPRRGHLVGVAGNWSSDYLWGLGNRPAYYVNAVNEDWRQGGVARADAIVAEASKAFEGKPPKWFLLNEISRNAWMNQGDDGRKYRKFLADLVKRLHVHHQRKVILFSPFWRPGIQPGHSAADWKAIAANAYIGVENYLSGAEIKAAGFSQSWCRDRYQESLTWYGRMGVGAGRIVMTEHFAQTKAGQEWGRAGVSIAEWTRAIRVRTAAAKSLPVFGFASYAWSFNQMHASNADRREFQDVYHKTLEGKAIVVPQAYASSPSNPPAAPPATCVDDCAAGAKACVDGDAFVECGDHDGDGCLDFGGPISCSASYGAGFTCSEGFCVGAEPPPPAGCTDECASGEKICVDGDQWDECGDHDGDGCTEWGAVYSCSASYGAEFTCSQGYCVGS